MKISRRDLVKASLVVGTALTVPEILRAQTLPRLDRTVRVVVGNLTVFDPVVTTADVTWNHAFAIYDTLFGADANLESQPQMVGKWGMSDDKKTYTFELRDGLGWHDGTPVTAADCVASIRRWAEVAPSGALFKSRIKDISRQDDRTFTISLSEPFGALISILGFQGPFMMREKDANLPPTEQAIDNIGSGPFKFNHALARPGASFAYDRNEKYVPREEAPSGVAGGKIVKVDRVIWDNGLSSDQQTAFSALQAGEVDLLYSPPSDLLPVLESDPSLELEVLDQAGQDYFLRMNCLQEPFNNVKARQAMLHLIDQEAFLHAAFGESTYVKPVTSIFGNATSISNDENTGWYRKGGDSEKAKQLFREAGYAGQKIVILQATDWAEGSNMSQLLAAALRKIGINAELAPSDWGGLVARREKKEPVENGGWSIFISSDAEAVRGNFLASTTLPMSGERGWYGWPENAEYEALRAEFVNLETLAERKAVARKLQRIWWNYVPEVLLGQSTGPIARRTSLTGLIGVPAILPYWNMQKAPA
ncbi:ABC transporter substrate-binding protein [Rhizobium laguerreae]|uniref:ABC transporter substrate-binding protein n=1 Tax=Rhizobium TaxID=379 RepID=UPI001C83EB00|nr:MULTISPECIES: ABC transporter substrate-binding protein [Rhizobium]MBX5199786.1 ABC transporter substrate-binding protein [Rhizobium sp. NZLR10]MBX5212606.1 ABC transporter substrate-binding protein [Rhizobium sp. NZLR11]MBY3096082.1 ABC transporter substrate-binding protein [Rhizobium laguerreae]MBY5795473.1 ABC transporter substrate-binding protein [Rhizobium leguminosarum]